MCCLRSQLTRVSLSSHPVAIWSGRKKGSFHECTYLSRVGVNVRAYIHALHLLGAVIYMCEWSSLTLLNCYSVIIYMRALNIHVSSTHTRREWTSFTCPHTYCAHSGQWHYTLNVPRRFVFEVFRALLSCTVKSLFFLTNLIYFFFIILLRTI